MMEAWRSALYFGGVPRGVGISVADAITAHYRPRRGNALWTLFRGIRELFAYFG